MSNSNFDRRSSTTAAFRNHLVAYLIGNAVLIGIWALSGAGYFWPAWTLLFGAGALALHGWRTFGDRS